MFAKRAERPFITKVVLFAVLICNKLIILLIDWVVGQMHVLVLFVYFLGVSFTRKSCQAFLMDVYSQRLVASYAHIDAQVKFVAINEQWVRDVLANYWCLVNVYIVYVVYEIDSLALTAVSRLYDPDILLAFVLFQLLIMIVKVTELIGQNVCVRRKVKSMSTKLFLHSNDVEAHPVFAGNLVGLWKFVDLLILVQTFILVRFAAPTGPQKIPFVTFRLRELMVLEQRTDHTIFKSYELNQQLWIFNVETFAVVVGLEVRIWTDSFFNRSVFKDYELWGVFAILIVETRRPLSLRGAWMKSGR